MHTEDLSAKVSDDLTVLDDSAGVVELRGRLILAAIERGARGNHLERRSRRVALLRRAVQERLAIGLENRWEVGANLGEIKARFRHHREHRAGRWDKRDDRSAPPGKRHRSRLLDPRVEREVHVRAAACPQTQALQQWLRAVASTEVTIVARLDPGLSLLGCGVAEYMGREGRLGVDALEHALSADTTTAARCENLSVSANDSAALNEAIALQRGRVVASTIETVGGHDLPVPEHGEHQAKTRGKDNVEATDRAIHDPSSAGASRGGRSRHGARDR